MEGVQRGTTGVIVGGWIGGWTEIDGFVGVPVIGCPGVTVTVTGVVDGGLGFGRVKFCGCPVCWAGMGRAEK
jgi:hypothetical protein